MAEWKSSPGARHPTDNTRPELKAELRRQLLEYVEKPRVLDLFCGAGEMYRRVYAGKVAEYVGVDREKIHRPKLCVLMDNRQYIAGHDITRFNVIDLDDYGCPWALIYRVLERAGPGPLTLFVTDGLPKRFRLSGRMPHIVSATNAIPRGMNVPAGFRFYVPMFKTMLLDVEERFGWHVASGLYGFAALQTVAYWGLRLERRT